MKAAVYHGIEDIRVEEVETPECGAGEIKIKVHYCAICGTDVRIYYHGHKKVEPPAIVGHEITGTIEEIGEGVQANGLKKGDKVAVVTSIGCASCDMCEKGLYNLCPNSKAIGYYYSGGFAEYLVVPKEAVAQDAVIKLSEDISLLEGSLIEALSCALNAHNYLRIGEGETVVIYGGGPIGFMHAVIAQAAGARNIVVVDPAYDRLMSFGKQFDGILLWDASAIDMKKEIMKLTDGAGADVVITACPAKQAQVEGIEILGARGRISLFGGLPKDDSLITVDANVIHYKELSVFGAFASNREDYVKAAELIAGGKIDAKKLISKVLPLENVVEGIELVKKGEAHKCVVEIS